MSTFKKTPPPPVTTNDNQTALTQLAQYTQQINRTLKIALPIFAFLLAVVFANFNLISPFTTFLVLALAFLMVGVWRSYVLATFILLILYCVVDNYLSFGQHFAQQAFIRQCAPMLLFTAIVWYTRRTADRTLRKRLGIDPDANL